MSQKMPRVGGARGRDQRGIFFWKVSLCTFVGVGTFQGSPYDRRKKRQTSRLTRLPYLSIHLPNNIFQNFFFWSKISVVDRILVDSITLPVLKFYSEFNIVSLYNAPRDDAVLFLEFLNAPGDNVSPRSRVHRRNEITPRVPNSIDLRIKEG